MRLVDVQPQELRLADAPVDRAREHHRMIAQDIRECDGRAAEDPATKVVALVPDRGAHHVIGRETHLVRTEREFVRVR